MNSAPMDMIDVLAEDETPRGARRTQRYGEQLTLDDDAMVQKYIKPERIWLRNHADLSEKWVQDLIADDPSILGLGDLILRSRERIQPLADRLDLLLQDPDTKRRYEVEIQLGSTDEAHTIRTIEYWDIERKRYPQYDHCAVLIAEDITSRFLNVVSLFNGTVPSSPSKCRPSRYRRSYHCDFYNSSG